MRAKGLREINSAKGIMRDTHRRFQHFLAVYSAIKMTNDSFKFYFHILLPIKFETVVADKILHRIRPVVWHVMLNKMINK